VALTWLVPRVLRLAKTAAGALIVAVSLAVCPAARAQGSSDRTTVASTIERLKQDPHARSVAARAISEATKALKRADAASRSGDWTRRQLLEALAQKWANSADDLARALRVERRATQVEQQLLSAQERLLRARALLEEAMARVERARAALGKLHGERGTKPEKDAQP
jgi:hypothetical protein